MVLRFKNPTEDDLKKVMIYGLDGTGKSTFAANYCMENGLSPVVIDVDDTNKTALFSQGRVLQLNMKTDKQVFNNIKSAIEEIARTPQFDTIIIDGVTSLLEMLTSDARGLAKYSDRSMRFNKILQEMLDSKKNIIFIGQIDMEVIFTEDFQSSKAVIKVNSLVNEKYLCYIDEKGNFAHEVKKYRTVEAPEESVAPKKEVVPTPKEQPNKQEKPSRPEPVPVMNETKTADVFMTAAEVGEPDPKDDPIRNSCQQIKIMLENEGKAVTKFSMRVKVVQLIKDEILPEENKTALLSYIEKHCPEELD